MENSFSSAFNPDFDSPNPDFGLSSSSSNPRLKVGILGCSKVGAVLGSALRALGHEIVGLTARSNASLERAEALLPGVEVVSGPELLQASNLVLVAVSDDALEPLVLELAQGGHWRPEHLVIHTCGAKGVSVLAPAAKSGALTLALHPAMTFSGTSLDLKYLPGCPWAVTASPLLLPIGQALVVELEGVPEIVAEEYRPRYHAALAHGANHLVTVVSQAARVLSGCGIKDVPSFLAPLLKTALHRGLHEGEQGLTGPVARADTSTIIAHLQALTAGEAKTFLDRDPNLPADDLSDVAQSYRQLARASAQRALATGRLTPSQVANILDVL